MQGRMERETERLRELELFAEVGGAGLQEVLATSSWQTCKRQEQIAHAEAGEDVIYVVVEGIVRLARFSPDGRVLMHSDLGPGKVFDFDTLLGVQSDVIIGTAVVDTTICMLPWPVFLRALTGAPASAAVVIGQLRKERQYFADLAGDAMLHDLATRVCHVVRRLALESEEHIITLTGEEIAWMAGTSKETVSRVLAALKRRGTARYHRQRELFIPDPDELL